jgi:hypothetical protein
MNNRMGELECTYHYYRPPRLRRLRVSGFAIGGEREATDADGSS